MRRIIGDLKLLPFRIIQKDVLLYFSTPRANTLLNVGARGNAAKPGVRSQKVRKGSIPAAILLRLGIERRATLDRQSMP